MPFVMNQDIPETYEELKQAFIAECKERYENNEHSRQLIRELNDDITMYEGEIANLEREKEELGEEIEELLEEKQRDTIAEARSARDRALFELKEVKELLRDSSCEDIAELVRDVRDNWKELKELTKENNRLKEIVDEVVDELFEVS